MMPGEMVETTSDERVMAALAHFFGLIAALIVWATQKDKSRFVRFQALQAMAFDAAFMLAYLLFMFCMMGVIFIFVVAAALSAAQSAPSDNLFPALAMGMIVPWSMFMCVLPLTLAAMLVRLVAAVSVVTGRNFRYPFIAARVDAFLKEPSAAAEAPSS